MTCPCAAQSQDHDVSPTLARSSTLDSTGAAGSATLVGCGGGYSGAPVPRRAMPTAELVGLLTPELGRRAFSSGGLVGQPDNGKWRCVAREHSVTAAGPFRFRTGFPVRRSRQATGIGHQHLFVRKRVR